MIYFAHISDLHFGDTLINRRGGLVPGQRPHDVGKCMALPSGLEAAMIEAGVPDDAGIQMIVSGDLTVSGSKQQLAVAHAFIRSRPAINRLPGPYGRIGLNVGADSLGAIPGNHDHWGGNRTTLTAYNGSLFPNDFRATPWMKSWPSYGRDFEVDVFGIDSNSGLKPPGRFAVSKRLAGSLARGSISNDEFAKLENLLQGSAAKSSDVVRIIVCHHSVSYRSGLLGTLELEQTSRDRLLKLAADYGVAGILTGHAHMSHYAMLQTRDSSGNYRRIHELRCSATVGWPMNAKEEAGFLFHRVIRQGTGWNWDIWRYGWDGSGFSCATSQPWQPLNGIF